MSTPCTNCKDSILNKTPTLIGSPLCNGDCPEDYVCLDITPAGCVSIQGKEDCITNGDTVQEQIDNIRDYVCNISCTEPSWLTFFERPEAGDLIKVYLDECKSKVEFQGSATLDGYESGGIIFPSDALPLIYRPSVTRRVLVLLTSLPSTNGCGVFYGHLVIDTDGSLRLEFDEEWLDTEYPSQGDLPYSPKLHFDNISYFL